MSLEVRMGFEPIRSLGFASIGAAYMGVGTSLANPARMIFVTNSTNAELMFSFDGTTDHFALPASGFLLLDISANKTVSSGFFLAQGDRLYVKEIGNPSSGNVYFSVIYGQGE